METQGGDLTMDRTFVYLGQQFLWDREKAATNLAKHHVSFEQSCEIFFDPFVTLLDTGDEDEPRIAAVGITEDWTLLFVVHLAWEGNAIRIISAREATTHERRAYENPR